MEEDVVGPAEPGRERVRRNRRVNNSAQALWESEQEHRVLFEQSCVGILGADARTKRFVYANPAICKLLGYAPAELLRLTLSDIHPKESLPRVKKDFQSLLRGRLDLARSVPCLTKDGSVIYADIAAAEAIVGGRKSAIGFFSDVTERQRAEDALRRLMARHEAILAEIPDIVMEVDANRVYTWANPAGYEFFGDEVIGKEAAAYFMGAQDTYANVQPLFDGCSGTFYVESWQRRKDDQRRLLAWWCIGLKDGEGRVTGALSTARDITERQRAEQALRESEERYRGLVNNSLIGIGMSRGNQVIFANPALLRIFGFDHLEEFVKVPLLDHVAPRSRALIAARMKRAVRGKPVPAEFEYDILRRDGHVRTLQGASHHLTLSGEVYTQTTFQDVTEQKRAEEARERLEAQLLQAHKMESIGRLAGGVAHDFNNKLQTILGNVYLALEETTLDPSLREMLVDVREAAQHSADLTRQLLAFARKQVVSPKVLDLNDTVTRMLKMLRRLIGENIDLAWIPGVELGHVRIDPFQIDQILANLCVNARDAIVGAGKITLETGTVIVDDTYCAEHADTIPGAYVMLSVSDNGCGMPKDVVEHVFEPFFTTKDVGHGTGLGLATVYGIVKQNEGFINVYSEPGVGTTFRICLPRLATEAAEAQDRPATETPPAGDETVLVVEDEAGLLKLIKRVLKRHGYIVLSAATPDEAIQQAQAHRGAIHLLITDVVMPRMNGRELAEHLAATRPDMKFLYTSGYPANVIADHGMINQGVQFIQKPFSSKEFAAKVRTALDA